MINVCLISEEGEVLSEKPSMFELLATIQLYFVPNGTMSLPIFVGVTVNSSPLQIIFETAEITTFGFTLIVVLKFEPMQPSNLGVTSYNIDATELVVFSNVLDIFD